MNSTEPIILLCNDSVFLDLVAAVESIRAFSPDRTIFYIPYDDNMTAVNEVADRLGLVQLDYDFRRLDKFGETCFPANPQMRQRVRKLACFGFHFGRFVYIDVDVIICSNFLDELFALDLKCDIVYGSQSRGWVYNSSAPPELLSRSHFFSSGFLLFNNAAVDTDMILATVEDNFAEYERVRTPGVIDQPILNFFVDKTNLQARSIEDLLPSYTRETFVEVVAPHGEFDGQLLRYRDKLVPFVHWAGPSKFEPERFAAVARLRQAHIRTGIRRIRGEKAV